MNSADTIIIQGSQQMRLQCGKVWKDWLGGDSDTMEIIMGHSLTPSWHGMTGEEVPIWKGCTQGAPESPALWNILLDEAVGPVLRRCQELGYGGTGVTSRPWLLTS